MILVAKDDVLRGLKKFKRLAKQDLLASSLTSNPDFWEIQAEARRQKYDELMELVKTKGVDLACKLAMSDYAKLPLFDSDQKEAPAVRGKEQALEMFFTLLGIGSEKVMSLRASITQQTPWSTEEAMEV
ncbi:MAG: hypothetical protein GX316_10745 [Firmicutes bacterium]|nr:hypothetical protein [Bacillota bacterium]